MNRAALLSARFEIGHDVYLGTVMYFRCAFCEPNVAEG